MDGWTIALIVVGIALIASEFATAAFVGGFFGLAALLTAGLRAIGIIDGVVPTLLAFAASSLALIVPGRLLADRLVPGRSERRKDTVDVEHDRDAMGELVDVVEAVGDDHDDGRIRFQGTTWQARSVNGSIAAGSKAQLVYREGSLWVVEPVVVDGGARDLFAGLDAAERERERASDEAAVPATTTKTTR